MISGFVIAILLVWWCGKRFSGDARSTYPRKPINVVVPYPAGGGSDTFVRILQRGIDEGDLVGQPFAISNIKGGGGTIGSRKVKDARPDGYWILCSHNAVITAKLSETVNYGADAFEPVCLTGTMAMVIIVREDSPFSDLPALLEAARDRPREITFGANQGSPAYFTTLQLLEEVPGAEFSIVSASGGADRYARIVGGHIDAGIFSLSEYIDFRKPDNTPSAENIRALVVMSPERHEAIPQVGCSKEQGIPVYSQNANYWFAPKETPQKVIDHLASALGKALENEGVLQRLGEIRVDPLFKKGDEFKKFLEESERQFVAVAAPKDSKLPNFPRMVSLIVAVLFLWVLVDGFLRRGKPVKSEIETHPFTPQYSIAILSALILIAYVAALQSERIPFAVITFMMVFLVGSLMSKWNKQHRIRLIELALITALGTEFVFTKIFTVALP